jgi:toxin-antitoxin system PIN domain toxin
VILVDANLLIYAHVDQLPQHKRAHSWLDAQLAGIPRVGLPWPSLLAFLRVVTNPRLFAPGESVGDAWQTVRAWLDRPNVWAPVPGPRHAEILASLLVPMGSGGNLVYDAHLAALAIEHGLTLCSTDGDFAHFPDLKWVNPLATQGALTKRP